MPARRRVAAWRATRRRGAAVSYPAILSGLCAGSPGRGPSSSADVWPRQGVWPRLAARTTRPLRSSPALCSPSIPASDTGPGACAVPARAKRCLRRSTSTVGLRRSATRRATRREGAGVGVRAGGHGETALSAPLSAASSEQPLGPRQQHPFARPNTLSTRLAPSFAFRSACAAAISSLAVTPMARIRRAKCAARRRCGRRGRGARVRREREARVRAAVEEERRRFEHGGTALLTRMASSASMR